jgi:type VI secretion system secreted protein Hcp
MAFEAYVKVTFTNQGASKGESPRPSHNQEIPVLKIDYQSEAPRDVSTGKNKGKRYHRPLTFLKEWGQSDPQFLAALWTNEVLTKVTFTFWQKDANGADQQKTQIDLTNAYVVKSRMYTGDANADSSSAATAKNASEYDTMELHEISLSFDKIEIQDMLGKTMASDSWAATTQADA